MTERNPDGTIPSHMLKHWAVSDPATISLDQIGKTGDVHFQAEDGTSIVLTMPLDAVKLTLDSIALELGYALQPIERR